MAKRRRFAAWLAACALLAGCRAMPPSPAPPDLPPPPVHPTGRLLWQVVSKLCLDGQITHHDPSPCAVVDVSQGVERGHVVLKDRFGRSQYLVMPTILIPGIEDPRLLAPDAADYFTPAWRVRQLVAGRLRATLPREDIAIAVNSIYGRSQDLLHLHVDCLAADVRDELGRALGTIGYHWSARPLVLRGHGYYAVRLDGDDAVAGNPFALVAQGLHVRTGDMGAWTIVLAGESFADGRPGFVLLAARADPSAGYNGSGEMLQDHGCAVVRHNIAR